MFEEFNELPVHLHDMPATNWSLLSWHERRASIFIPWQENSGKQECTKL